VFEIDGHDGRKHTYLIREGEYPVRQVSRRVAVTSRGWCNGYPRQNWLSPLVIYTGIALDSWHFIFFHLFSSLSIVCLFQWSVSSNSCLILFSLFLNASPLLVFLMLSTVTIRAGTCIFWLDPDCFHQNQPWFRRKCHWDVADRGCSCPWKCAQEIGLNRNVSEIHGQSVRPCTWTLPIVF
jgi:hypothetical protein